MDSLCHREIVAYQELQKLGFVDLQAGQRQKLWVLLTAEGENVRSAGYFSKRAVLRMTEPQINLLRFLADTDDMSIGPHSSEIPDTMLDVCRRRGGRIECETTLPLAHHMNHLDAGQRDRCCRVRFEAEH